VLHVLGAEVLLEDQVRLGEAPLHVAPAHAVVIDDVGAVGLVDQRGSRLQGFLRIEQGGQRLGLHAHEGGGGDRLGPGIRDHHRHHVAVAADPLSGQHGVILEDLPEHGAAGDVRRRKDPDHPGGADGLAGVNLDDPGVHVIGVDRRRMQQPVEFQIVGVAGPPGDLGHGVVAPGGLLQIGHRLLPDGWQGSSRKPSRTTSRPRRYTRAKRRRVVRPG
jgi:hypothetical protein